MRIFLICCLSLLLVACGDDRPERLQANIKTADYLIGNLGNNLNDNRIRNAVILQQYAQLLTQRKPELRPLLTELSKDATRNGPMYRSLTDRLSTLKKQPAILGDIEAQLFESETLIEASDPSLFNDALSDPINVIADMSDGELARVNAISKSQSLRANGADDNGAGSQLVGNPGYGEWQTNNSGMSFWHWYGMYAMFSAISPRPIGYNRWSSGRDYSYYNDVGRNRYTSPQQKKSQDNLANRTKKQFGNRGSFNSPYAKTKTGASRMSTASQKAQRAPSFAGKSSYSRQKASTSSFRNSTSTTSRGIRRGK
ncbi:hypothetical protein E2R68_02590 [Psychromonas sp. RZ22]|uniref:hypothetical protein n=1 Tax=Psychromonas algarum TaxID=2555643 RepID=UPI0010685486|nr:hypothetical protein [Psychromonas sp. RZ22]TEW55998.1 hypothetical protein E2R68_02590 [Psychromonas sp. RZ22]